MKQLNLSESKCVAGGAGAKKTTEERHAEIREANKVKMEEMRARMKEKFSAGSIVKGVWNKMWS